MATKKQIELYLSKIQPDATATKTGKVNKLTELELLLNKLNEPINCRIR